MTRGTTWGPSHREPVFLLAMDHRGSFGSSLFGVEHDRPTAAQTTAMQGAKDLIFRGLLAALDQLPAGVPGVLVDEQYGAAVVAAASRAGDIALALPIEASGHEWFAKQYGAAWWEHVHAVGPDLVKVLVRDNPAFDRDRRAAQLRSLAEVSAVLLARGGRLLFELLVPPTAEQSASVGGDADRYDRGLRPELVAQVIADNQAYGVEPYLWKVEGLETSAAARAVAAQARTGGRTTGLVVLGRDAPAARLDHWLDVAAGVEAFVGFAIGRSIWEDALRGNRDGSLDDDATVRLVTERYVGFARRWAGGRS